MYINSYCARFPGRALNQVHSQFCTVDMSVIRPVSVSTVIVDSASLRQNQAYVVCYSYRFLLVVLFGMSFFLFLFFFFFFVCLFLFLFVFVFLLEGRGAVCVLCVFAFRLFA